MKKLTCSILLLLLIPVISFGFPTIQDIKKHGIVTYPMVLKIRQKAKLGDVFSQANIGEALINGVTGVLPNYSRSIYWLTKAKDNCDKVAKTENGRVIPGCALAYLNLGILYMQGNGVPQDRHKFEQYTKIGFDAYQKLKDEYEPYQLTTVQYKIANIYLWGVKGVAEQDLQKAFTLYKQSAEKGFVHSIKRVALMYYLGLGVKTNLAMAQKWYTLLAKSADPAAQYVVGLNYLNGVGTKKDIKQGVYWIHRSFLNGYYPALVKFIELNKQGLASFPIPEAQQGALSVLHSIAENMGEILSRYPIMRI